MRSFIISDFILIVKRTYTLQTGI